MKTLSEEIKKQVLRKYRSLNALKGQWREKYLLEHDEIKKEYCLAKLIECHNKLMLHCMRYDIKPRDPERPRKFIDPAGHIKSLKKEN